jgi:hypothetical protein
MWQECVESIYMTTKGSYVNILMEGRNILEEKIYLMAVKGKR